MYQNERKGIAIVGNLLSDIVKMIDIYPKTSMLSNIISISRAVGGCVPNTGIDLAVIDRTLPILGIGCTGDDEMGRYVVSELNNYGINTDGVTVLKGSSTGFSDVMTVQSTGERTFFHHRGANALFSPEHVDISALNCKMLHIGYILLLDKFDTRDDEYGTVMARFLKEVKDAGIKTSIDVVSDSGDRFAEMVIPALRYTDNAIMNEIEGCGVLGIAPRDENGQLIVDNIKKAMEYILSCGVSERVIIHCPEAGFILNRDGDFTVVPSISLPAGYIKGTVGAGDAFCAGCLYGIYNGMSDQEILEFASGAAVCNLTAQDSVSGMRSKDEIYKIINSCQRQTL